MTDKFERNNNEAHWLFERLAQLRDKGILEPSDAIFPRWLYQRLGEKNPSVLLAAAHLNCLTRQGHVGVHIPLRYGIQSLFGYTDYLPLKEAEKEKMTWWCRNMPEALSNSVVTGNREDDEHPLIYDQHILYFQRFWRYEVSTAQLLLQKATEKMPEMNTEKANEWIQTLLPGNQEEINWPQLALWMSLRRRLLILTGGPGTGKTYTLIRLVALHYLLQNRDGSKIPSVALAAPTGKATARINESVRQSLQGLSDIIPADLMKKIPSEAQTIHRLLGTLRNKPEFIHNQKNPLTYDLVVIDEASMVDIALMTKLLEALKPETQLILIGDKDQLASVEAGSVLGDICLAGQPDEEKSGGNFFSGIFCRELDKTVLLDLPAEHCTETSPLSDCIVELEKSHRFRASPEIGNLAACINQNLPEKALSLLLTGSQVSLNERGKLSDLSKLVREWEYSTLPFDVSCSRQIFKAWKMLQILCAHHRGPMGSLQINTFLDGVMQQQNGLATDRRYTEWYAGRPIMITENNYEQGLFNGDIGITVTDKEHNGQLWVCFESANHAGKEPFRLISPAQLTRYQSAWALTVHKAQGSEFDEVLLLMPTQISPILTRELLYTALTRARQKFTIWSNREIFKTATGRKIHRAGALQDRLTSGFDKNSDLL